MHFENAIIMIMKRFPLFVLFCVSLTNAQIDVKTYFEKINHGTQLFADNNEPCPVSIRVKLKLDNLKSSENETHIFILPANTKRIKLNTLTIVNKRKKFKVGISTNYNYGNHFLDEYDADHIYDLPYQNGKTFMLSQGYNGKLSHQNKNQLDFSMPVGTPIVAAREGLVIKVLDVNTKHCGSQECEQYNNYIYIYHDDGSISEYLHIKRNGAKVKVGERVKQGQLIAESGNVGWSTGPHLHFSVFLQRLDGERKYLKTKFKLNENTSDYLVEHEMYEKTYD